MTRTVRQMSAERFRAALEALPVEVVARFRLDRLPFDRPARSATDLLRLDGKRALVTGAGGTGLGLATCHRLAEQGAAVAALDISLPAARATVEAVRDRWGVPGVAVRADVGDRAEVAAAVAAVCDELGGIDLLVNNAGGGLGGGEFAEVADDYIERVVSLNLLGVLRVTRAVLPTMIASGAGRIVNVSSEGGKVGAPLNVVYNTCKSAVIGFTRNLAHETGPRGVSTVCVCPGLMVAERNADFMGNPRSTPLRIMADAMERTTLGRCSLPDEVASMIAFLCSEAGSYVHGTAVSVGGGLSD